MKLEDTLNRLADNKDECIIFAGGTDLMVQFHAGARAHKTILDISRLGELKGVKVSSDTISIGALTTYSQIRRHPQIAQEFPMLKAAAKATGALAIQNRGTIGGNIANASPAADTPPALLAYDARIIVGSSNGLREIPYKDFHLGYKRTALKNDEIILKILLPRRYLGFSDYYEKIGAREAQAISKVGIAFTAKRKGVFHGVRIAYSSVAPVPLRCVQTENILEGQVVSSDLIEAARLTLRAEISPIDDIRSTTKYRTQVALNLLKTCLARHLAF